MTRKLCSEALEPRVMMAADTMHNFLFPHDVDNDGSVTPLDALVVINHLNSRSDSSSVGDLQFDDVDDDSQVTPLDALILINDLNAKSLVQKPNSVSQSTVLSNPTTGTRVRIELDTDGAETELQIRVDNAPVSSSFPVTLNDIALGQLVTDVRGRGQITFGHGEDNQEHLPLPDGLTILTPDMELVIGDIVRGKLSQVANVEGHETGAPTPPVAEYLEQHFQARFDRVAGVNRSASYEQETERGVIKRQFEAEIENATPNSIYDVSVGGVRIGEISTNARGRGKLHLSSAPENSSEHLIPINFPVIGVGVLVKIGDVQNALLLSN